jgi:hypothetical protein
MIRRVGRNASQGPTGGCTYRVPPFQVGILVALFALAPAACGELLFDVILRWDIPYGALLWLAIGLWNAYWFLLRFAHRVDLDPDGTLCWRAPLRRGSVAVADLRKVRPSLLFSNIQILDTGRGRPAMVWAVRGFGELAGALDGRSPGLPCQLSPQARLAARLPLRSAFRAGAGLAGERGFEPLIG